MIRQNLTTLLLVFIFCQYGLCQSKDSLDRLQANAKLAQVKAFYQKLPHDPVYVLPTPCDTTAAATIQHKLELATHLTEKGNWQCAEHILMSLLQRQTALRGRDRVLLYIGLAEFVDRHQMYDSARAIAQIGKAMAHREVMPAEECRMLLLLSHGAAQQDKLLQASQWADSALAIARKCGDKKLESHVLFQIGACARRYFTAPSFRTLPYYEQSLEIARELNDSNYIFLCNWYLGDDIGQTNDLFRSMPYFETAFNVAMATGNIFERYAVMLHIAVNLMQYGEGEKGMKLLLETASLARAQRLPYNEEHCYMQISNYFFRMHQPPQYDSALHYIDLAQNVEGVDSSFTNFAMARAEIYYAMKDYLNAAIDYKTGIDEDHQNFLINNQQQLNGWEAQLHTKEKELEIVKQENARKNLYYLLIVAAALLVMVGWAFNVQRVSRRKLAVQNAIVVNQAHDLQQSLNEKEMLLREIHHRVKNNLEVISSMLELQGMNTSDETAKNALSEGQNRVYTIALIHQRLYQHENIAEIEIKGLAEDLYRQVAAIFHSGKQKIDFVNGIPLTTFDIDTAVPLGLMLNELFTNAFKYAFDVDKTGQLHLSLRQDAGGMWILTIRDNGRGMPAGYDFRKSRSLGMRLLHVLSRQLHGSITYSFDEGSVFVICFKDTAARKKTL